MEIHHAIGEVRVFARAAGARRRRAPGTRSNFPARVDIPGKCILSRVSVIFGSSWVELGGVYLKSLPAFEYTRILWPTTRKYPPLGRVRNDRTSGGQSEQFHFRTEQRHQGGAIGGHLIICDGDAALKEPSISRQRLSAKMHNLKLKIVCGEPGAQICITPAMG